MSSAAPSRFQRSVRAVVLTALLAAFVSHLLASRRQRQVLELLRVENRLLDQENRLLRQHLEAERLQSAALARLLQDAPAKPAAAKPAAAGPSAAGP